LGWSGSKCREAVIVAVIAMKTAAYCSAAKKEKTLKRCSHEKDNGKSHNRQGSTAEFTVD